MTAPQRDLLDRLFAEAHSLRLEERSAFLDRHCPDRDVRSELESLLSFAATQEVNSPIAGLIEYAAGDWAFAGLIGQRVGPYRITGRIGHGGMGSVYQAVRDDDEFQKTVAIKMLRFGDGDPVLIQRFRRERQILASLEHSNIARLMDGGAWIPSGAGESQPYIVMEYVEGLPITTYCTHNNLSIRQRLALIRQACDAISYAHQKLIVHRDIKPDNILVMADGTVKLLDFGIAKLLDSGLGEASTQTATGIRMLTPDYASPEQVRGEEVSTVTDVYALGVVLYELLAGTRPHKVSLTDPLAMIRTICEADVQPPSAIGGRELRGDLDIIVLKALNKDPARRYPSAEQLSEDIRRYLDGRPILARPDSMGYRVSKFVRRHWLALSAAVVVLLAVGISVGIALHQARIARMRFEQVRKLANTFLIDVWRNLRDLPGSTPTQELLVKTGLEYVDSLASEASGDPELQSELANAYEKLGDIQGFPGEPNLGDFAACQRSFEKALRMREAVWKAHPSNPVYARRLASTYAAVSSLDIDAGHFDASKAHAQTCIDLLAAAMKLQPGVPDDLIQTGRCENKLGDAASATGGFAEGVEHYQRSLDLRKQVLKAQGTQYHRILVASDYSRVADAQAAASNLDASLEAVNAGLQLMKENLATGGGTHNNIRYYTNLTVAAARILLDPRKLSADSKAETAKLLSHSDGLVSQQVEIDPKNIGAKIAHATVDRWYVRVLAESNPGEALRHTNSTVAALQSYLAGAPHQPDELRATFADLLSSRITLLRLLGRHGEAMEAATLAVDNARKITPGTGLVFTRTAVLARALVTMAELQPAASEAVFNELLALKTVDGPVPFENVDLFAASFYRAGKLLAAQGRKREAATAHRTALSLWKQWQQSGVAGEYEAARVAEIDLALQALIE